MIDFENCWYKDVCIAICSQTCPRFLEMSYLMGSSGIPENRQIPAVLEPGNDSDYELFMQLNDIKSDMQDFVKHGNSMYICSENTGNGKTSWALKLMLKYFDDVWCGNGFRTRGLFIHIPTFLTKLKNFSEPFPESYKHDIMECDLVVWDDIASTNMSSFDLTNLSTYIDTRVMRMKSNIYTGNITDFSQLEKQIGKRLASRIYTASDYVFEFTGSDRRSRNGKIKC